MTDQDKTRIWREHQADGTAFSPDEKTVIEGSTPVEKTEAAGSSPLHDTAVDEAATVLQSPDLTRGRAARTAFGGGGVFPGDQETTVLTEPNQPDSDLSFFSVGDVIKNRFQILESLGEGGMGMVFKAVDIRKLEARSRNPHVAIKVLNPALARNAVLVAALQRECEKAQALSHPNIITVYDFDRDGDHVFMSMEYLVGQPLTHIIRDAALAGGMKIEKAWPIIRSMGEALAYAHKKHIVHSDFKPANVFVTDSGEVKVLDFGIAAKLDHTDESDLTVFDARLEGGLTPPYASFEMMNGGKADPRDDIYAFGLVVYEMLTGKHPYQRKPASQVFFDQQREGRNPPLAPVSGLSRKQWRLLKSAVELLQAQRPKSLDDWLLEFEPKSGNVYLKAGLGFISAAGLAVLIAYGWFFRQAGVESPANTAAVAVNPPANTVETAVKPPLAGVGPSLQGKVGAPVVLDGGASKAADGGALGYEWRLIERPDGSNSELSDAGSVSPRFIPDRPGAYKAELVVTDAGNLRSMPALVVVDVSQPAPSAQLLQQASSADGVLYLAAGKSQYRIGEDLTLSIRLAKPGYLRVAYVGANGEVSELLPNQYQPGKVKADVEYRIPPKPNSFKLEVTGPVGVDKVVAVFSETPLPKVKDIVNSDGSLVAELLNPGISSVLIGYDVLKKAG